MDLKKLSYHELSLKLRSLPGEDAEALSEEIIRRRTEFPARRGRMSSAASAAENYLSRIVTDVALACSYIPRGTGALARIAVRFELSMPDIDVTGGLEIDPLNPTVFDVPLSEIAPNASSHIAEQLSVIAGIVDRILSGEQEDLPSPPGDAADHIV